MYKHLSPAASASSSNAQKRRKDDDDEENNRRPRPNKREQPRKKTKSHEQTQVGNYINARQAQFANMLETPPPGKGLILCVRRSTTKIEDNAILEEIDRHHQLAMQTVVPLLVKYANTYEWQYCHLNGVESFEAPPPFGLGARFDYYRQWADAISNAVQRNAPEIILVVQSPVGWTTLGPSICHWMKGAVNAGIPIRLLFWHMGTSLCQTAEGGALQSHYQPIRDGDLGYFLEFSSSDLARPVGNPTATQTTTSQAWMAFENFCGAHDMAMQGVAAVRAAWEPIERNFLEDEEVALLKEELSRRKIMEGV